MNIAVVGCGHWGKNIVKTLYSIGYLYAVCDKNVNIKEFLSNYGEKPLIYNTFDALLEDKNIDGIIISTPAEMHYSLAQKCIEKKIPVLVEKPMTTTLEESKYLVNVAKEQNTLLMTGHLLLYHPPIRTLIEISKSEKYGKIKHIRCTRVNLGRIRAFESVWWSFAPHDLSVIFKLIDEEPINTTIHAPLSIQKDLPDTVYVNLDFEKGQSAYIHASWLEPNKRHETVVVCENAFITYDDCLKELSIQEYTYDQGTIELIRGDKIDVPFDKTPPLELEILDFIDCIENHKIPESSGVSAIKVIQTLETVEKQLRKE